MVMPGSGMMPGAGMGAGTAADPKKAQRLMNEALALLEKADKLMEDGNFAAARDAYKQAKGKMDTVANGEPSAAGGAMMPGGGGAMMPGGGGPMMPGGGGAMMPGSGSGMPSAGGAMAPGGAGGGGLIANDGDPKNMKLRMEARKIHVRALRGLGNAWVAIATGLMASPDIFLDPWTTSQGQGNGQGTGQTMLPGGGPAGGVGRGGGGGGAASAPAGGL